MTKNVSSTRISEIESIEKQKPIQSVELALSILTEVSKQPDLRLTEIASKLGETKSRTLRSLRTMQHRGFIHKTPDQGYRLGHTMLLLAAAASTQIDLVKIAGPILETLGTKVNESVQLRIRDNNEALCIAKFEAPRDLRVHVRTGGRRPLHAGSSKVLLAHLSRKLQLALIPDPLSPLTPRTITDRDILLEELDRIREQGYCISRGEVRDHLVAVSVPVKGFDNMVVASLNVVAPAVRTEQADLDRFLQLLLEATEKLSAGLTA